MSSANKDRERNLRRHRPATSIGRAPDRRRHRPMSVYRPPARESPDGPTSGRSIRASARAARPAATTTAAKIARHVFAAPAAARENRRFYGPKLLKMKRKLCIGERQRIARR